MKVNKRLYTHLAMNFHILEPIGKIKLPIGSLFVALK